jgi:hypothetical protein
MATKAEIRRAAKDAEELFARASSSRDEREGDVLVTQAMARLREAAHGKGDASLREAAVRRRTEPLRLLERDFSTAERVALAKQGHALPVKNDHGEIVSGRYPIKTRADVEAAVHDADRTGAGRKVRKHIIAQAKRVGASDVIPASWKGAKARESAPLTLREAVAVGEVGLLDAANPDMREDFRLGLLQRMGIDRDYLA